MADPRSRFGALKTFRQQGTESDAPSIEISPNPAPNNPLKEREKGTGGRPTGKRSNPEFEPTTVLLRKKTKRATSRLLEDLEDDKDLSELIEALLIQWIAVHS